MPRFTFDLPVPPDYDVARYDYVQEGETYLDTYREDTVEVWDSKVSSGLKYFILKPKLKAQEIECYPHTDPRIWNFTHVMLTSETGIFYPARVYPETKTLEWVDGSFKLPLSDKNPRYWYPYPLPKRVETCPK